MGYKGVSTAVFVSIPLACTVQTVTDTWLAWRKWNFCRCSELLTCLFLSKISELLCALAWGSVIVMTVDMSHIEHKVVSVY